ncbi:MAG: BrnA antitoxin family protein [Treponemataceae bacterium]|nr:BrnA antitoxin family protein [Treponemataceae bacterium]
MITSDKLTAERIAEIEKFPISYDEVSPKFSAEELNEFVPFHKEYYDITPKKVLVSFKVDADILAIMKATGKGYQTRMNKCLREAVLEGRF